MNERLGASCISSKLYAFLVHNLTLFLSSPGEHPAAMQHGNANTASPCALSVNLLISLYCTLATLYTSTVDGFRWKLHNTRWSHYSVCWRLYKRVLYRFWCKNIADMNFVWPIAKMFCHKFYIKIDSEGFIQNSSDFWQI